MATGPGTIWQKVAQPGALGLPVWVAVGNMIGPAGAQGSAGASGQRGPAGAPSSGPPGAALQEAYGYCSADTSCSSNVTAVSTPLTLYIGANQTWLIEYYLTCTVVTASSGIGFSFTGPASPTKVLRSSFGNTTSTALFVYDLQSGFAGTTNSFGTGSGGNSACFVRKAMVIENGANAGLVTLQIISAINTDTVTLQRGSYMVARRIA